MQDTESKIKRDLEKQLCSSGTGRYNTARQASTAAVYWSSDTSRDVNPATQLKCVESVNVSAMLQRTTSIALGMCGSGSQGGSSATEVMH